MDDTLPAIKGSPQDRAGLPITFVRNAGRGAHSAVMAGFAARASARDLLSCIELVVVLLAAWINVTPVSKVNRFCSAAIRLWDSAELLKPESNFVGSPLD